MKQFLVASVLALALSSFASAANAEHCRKAWKDCVFEELQKTGS